MAVPAPVMSSRYGVYRYALTRYNYHGIETQAEYLNLPAWERHHGGVYVDSPVTGTGLSGLPSRNPGAGIVPGSGPGVGGAGTSTGSGSNGSAGGTAKVPETFGGAQTNMNLTAGTTTFYTIEVYDAIARSVKNTVAGWFNGMLETKLQQASILTFQVLGDNSDLSDIQDTDYRIFLRDRWGFMLGNFRFSKIERIRKGSEFIAQITAIDSMAQLAQEVIEDYETTNPDTGKRAALPVGQIVADLLELQAGSTNKIRSFVDEGINFQEVHITFKKMTILDCFIKLQQRLEKRYRGAFYMSSQNKFTWLKRIGVQGQTFNSTDVIKNDNYTIDQTDLITRIYLYGEGQTEDTRLDLQDAGLANNYLDRNTGTYGVRSAIKIDNRVKDPETLLRMAKRILDDKSEPNIKLTIDLTDLSKAVGTRFAAFSDVFIGSEVTILDSQQGINKRLDTFAIDYSLDNPLPLRFEVGRRAENIDQILSDMLSQQNPPFDINGDDGTDSDLYPNIVRGGYTGDENDPDHGDYIPGFEFRDGDVKMVTNDRWVYTNGNWKLSVPLYTAATFATLQSDSTVEAYAMGYDEADSTYYKRDSTNTSWEPISGSGTYNSDTNTWELSANWASWTGA